MSMMQPLNPNIGIN